jgi:hypothetical protein
MRLRLLICTLIGLASGFLCWAILDRNHQDAGDFRWAIRVAEALLHHQNPYTTPLQRYPVTAGFFALPFVHLRMEVAGGIFFGLSSSLLAFGLTRRGYASLFVFLAFPYWSSLITAQWAPLIMAGAFFPILMTTVLVKPQTAIPVAATHLTWKGVAGCVILFVASLAIMPGWPRLWLGQFHYYENYVPLFVFPGPVLLLALASRQDLDAGLLLTAAIMPQRWFYDAFILWLIPKTRRELLATAFLSWVPALLRLYHKPADMTEVGRWSLLWIYLPMLFVLLLRIPRDFSDAAQSESDGVLRSPTDPPSMLDAH